MSLDSTTKAVFREAMQGILPELIRTRRDKIGFVPPELFWLTTLNLWVQSVLNSEMAHTIPVLNIEIIKQEW